ncbi:MAG TPA: hypothetical protein DDX39_03445 [Bacteroidales bacterium]|nr:MAG: hypothetical protein A2W98_12875 [Bacteroidetes bacterium GWF2_33_38]OFY71420.1 MAG: hypothetical protein A2265_08385 [Bacteroidetes bacterium RIFOXYA12_FULL_33_9]OFY86070.1 MAG: hypothetical protein A2236_00500 [Bacteroidetes bacterium RIFOXYA2_FULL_33_7]HBF87674.1 hypothetical protein [Bacteroidales bacterium]
METKKTNRQNLHSKNQLNNYVKYSSVAFQMVAVILIGVFGGDWLDKYFEFKTPIFTIFLSLISVMGSIYLVLKDFIKK